MTRGEKESIIQALMMDGFEATQELIDQVALVMVGAGVSARTVTEAIYRLGLPQGSFIIIDPIDSAAMTNLSTAIPVLNIKRGEYFDDLAREADILLNRLELESRGVIPKGTGYTNHQKKNRLNNRKKTKYRINGRRN